MASVQKCTTEEVDAGEIPKTADEAQTPWLQPALVPYFGISRFQSNERICLF